MLCHRRVWLYRRESRPRTPCARPSRQGPPPPGQRFPRPRRAWISSASKATSPMRAACAAAMRGCDWCFHVAASYHLWLRNYAPMYAANVDGTRNVLQAAAQGRLFPHRLHQHRRLHRPAEIRSTAWPARPATNPRGSTPPNCPTITKSPSGALNTSHQIQSARNGVPVVIVNPSAPVGPRDVKPTPTGQVIVDFLNRQMPAYLDTGLNWVHVRDVAIGHILAAEKGRVGERYILGNADGNWTMKQTFAMLAGDHRPSRAEIASSLRRRLARRLRQRDRLENHRQTAASPDRRRPHGRLQNVFQPRQSHPRTWPAPNPAATSPRRRRPMVPRSRLCKIAISPDTTPASELLQPSILPFAETMNDDPRLARTPVSMICGKHLTNFCA